MRNGNITYYEFNKLRKSIVGTRASDHIYRKAKPHSPVLISAPHGVTQVRLGKRKEAEIGTISTASLIADRTGSNLIIKTRCNNDDANHDRDCAYRKEIERAIREDGVKYLIDIHGLAKFRECDINLGMNFGQNIKNDPQLFDYILEKLKEAGFNVTVDNPFAGTPSTIAGMFAKEFDIWTLQVEINCKLTNERVYIEKVNTLIDTISCCINEHFKK